MDTFLRLNLYFLRRCSGEKEKKEIYQGIQRRSCQADH